jgi:hypothetical protein
MNELLPWSLANGGGWQLDGGGFLVDHRRKLVGLIS